jgi:hypothetical protein
LDNDSLYKLDISINFFEKKHLVIYDQYKARSGNLKHILMFFSVGFFSHTNLVSEHTS